MASRQVELVVRRPGQPERRMILGPGVTHLGRAEDNDLVLPDIGVSRRHARIVVEGETFRFEDLGSGNGSFYNGNQVETQALSDGDEVVIEPFTLTFRVQAAVPLMGPSLEDDETLRAPPMDAFAGAPARLVTLAGHRLSSAYPLGGAPVALGRSEARDIVLYDPAASRNHAVVELRAEGFWARDFGSANGTYVNGHRVT
ncbi:MAG: FHA domain-containing protein, partial [Myxococcota bacterium]|nr:FHA domain-containing protein [Myxococcota bacterium]